MKYISIPVDLTKRVQPLWLAYRLHRLPGLAPYMGVCRISEMMNIPDAKKHPMFARFFPDCSEAEIELLGMFESKRDALIWRNKFLGTHGNLPMNGYFASYRGKVAVRCVDTDEVFETITECAQAHGISASNLSKHLKGHPNYRAVGGRKYEYARYAVSDTGVLVPCLEGSHTK